MRMQILMLNRTCLNMLSSMSLSGTTDGGAATRQQQLLTVGAHQLSSGTIEQLFVDETPNNLPCNGHAAVQSMICPCSSCTLAKVTPVVMSYRQLSHQHWSAKSMINLQSAEH